jgi:hypothetical protein
MNAKWNCPRYGEFSFIFIIYLPDYFEQYNNMQVLVSYTYILNTISLSHAAIFGELFRQSCERNTT